MTKNEAIVFGNMWLQMNDDSKNSHTYAFFQMALKAIEQEPFINKSCVSEKVCEHDKNEVLDKIKADVINIADGRRTIPVRSVIRIIDKHKAESEE